MERLRFGKLLLLVLLAGLAAVLLTSCNAGDMGYRDGDAMDTYASGSSAEYLDFNEEKFSLASVVSASEIRYVIRNGSMELNVPDTRETVRQINGVASSADGIVSKSEIYEFREGQYAARLTIRVPVDRFDAVMEQLQELGKANHVNHEEDDVTLPYVEMEARIRNLKVQEEQLHEIMEMAETVEEVLMVEKELGRIRGEIEVMTTQFNRLQDQVSYSTITVAVNEEVIATQKFSQAPFEGLGSRMKESFVRSINYLLFAAAGLLVFFTAALPVLIVLALAAVILWWIITRASRRRPPAAPE